MVLNNENSLKVVFIPKLLHNPSACCFLSILICYYYTLHVLVKVLFFPLFVFLAWGAGEVTFDSFPTLQKIR